MRTPARRPASHNRIYIFESEIEAMVGETHRFPNQETGGDLFGFWTHTLEPVVYLACGPGPGARRSSVRFHQDADYLGAMHAQAFDGFGAQHVGDWHSHHTLGLDRPSGVDCHTIDEVFRNHDLPGFIACIATLRDVGERESNWSRLWCRTNDRDLTVQLQSFLFRPEERAEQLCEWVLLPGVSPIRSAISEGRVKGDGTRRILYPRESSAASLRAQANGLELPDDAWYQTEAGAVRLRSELSALELLGARTTLRILPDSSELCADVKHDRARLRVTFPDGYPVHPPKGV